MKIYKNRIDVVENSDFKLQSLIKADLVFRKMGQGSNDVVRIGIKSTSDRLNNE